MPPPQRRGGVLQAPGMEAEAMQPPELRGARWAVRACTLLFAALALATARYGWFKGDDLAFLDHVQRTTPWSWFDPVAALEWRFWLFYRPLGMEAYYALGLLLFGLAPVGFVALALLTALATAECSRRIALHLGFAAPVAAAAGLLAISRPAATAVLYDGFSFQYVSAIALAALALERFLAWRAHGGAARLAASLVAMALGLLCNDLPALLPPLCALFVLRERRSLRFAALVDAARAAAPFAVLSLAWFVHRAFVVDAARVPDAYAMHIGWNLPRNLWSHLLIAFGDRPGFDGCLALAAALLGAAACCGLGLRDPEQRARLRSWCLPLQTLCLFWAAGWILPYSLFGAPIARWASVLALPISLAFAAALDLAWRAQAPQHPRAAAFALGALLVAALPWSTFDARRSAPRGLEVEALLRAVEDQLVRDAELDRLVVLYGAAGLASARDFERWRPEILNDGGALLRAALPERFPGRPLQFVWTDLGAPVEWPRRLGRCVFLELDARRIARPASPATLAALPSPALAQRCGPAD